MNHHLSLLLAHAEITRRIADAEQRRRARDCRTGRSLPTILRHRSAQL